MLSRIRQMFGGQPAAPTLSPEELAGAVRVHQQEELHRRAEAEQRAFEQQFPPEGEPGEEEAEEEEEEEPGQVLQVPQYEAFTPEIPFGFRPPPPSPRPSLSPRATSRPLVFVAPEIMGPPIGYQQPAFTGAAAPEMFQPSAPVYPQMSPRPSLAAREVIAPSRRPSLELKQTRAETECLSELRRYRTEPWIACLQDENGEPDPNMTRVQLCMDALQAQRQEGKRKPRPTVRRPSLRQVAEFYEPAPPLQRRPSYRGTKWPTVQIPPPEFEPRASQSASQRRATLRRMAPSASFRPSRSSRQQQQSGVW